MTEHTLHRVPLHVPQRHVVTPVAPLHERRVPC